MPTHNPQQHGNCQYSISETLSRKLHRSLTVHIHVSCCSTNLAAHEGAPSGTSCSGQMAHVRFMRQPRAQTSQREHEDKYSYQCRAAEGAMACSICTGIRSPCSVACADHTFFSLSLSLCHCLSCLSLPPIYSGVVVGEATHGGFLTSDPKLLESQQLHYIDYLRAPACWSDPHSMWNNRSKVH